MTTTKPNWQNGSLRPTGQLSIVESSIVQNRGTVGPCILAVDEAGVQWQLTDTSFVYDMHPHALPDPFPGRYCVEHLTGNRMLGAHYYVDATSLKDAIAKIEACESLYLKPGEGLWKFDLSESSSIQPATGEAPKRNW